MRSDKALLLLLLWLVATVGCEPSSGFPSRSILIVCPWAVGGGTDRVSRQLAGFLEVELGVPVNVLNATGGAGVTGHSRGAHARPDGYTLTMMTVEINMLHWRKLTRISWRDFTPLMLLNRDAAALFVRTDAPWKSLGDLTEEVRRQPGKLTASGTATGGIWHLALAGWLTSIGLEADAVRWIPSRGAGPSLQELNSGGVDVVCCSLPEARTLLLSDKIRALAVMADEPVVGAESVPTFRSQGVDWSMGGWRGIGAPRDLPSERAKILVPALRRIVQGRTRLQGKTFPELLAREWYDPSFEPPAKFRERLEYTDQALGQLLTSDAFASLRESPVSRHLFPAMLFGGLLAALALLALGRGRTTQPDADGPGQVFSACRAEWIHFAAVIGCVLLYVLAAEHLGFVLTAAVVTLILFRRLGTGWFASVLITLVLVPAVYHLFAHWLRVPLPRGLLGW